MRAMIAALAVLAAFGGGAQAQTLEDRLRSQLVSVTAQLRQVQAGQGQLQAQAAAAEKDRDALKTKLATAQAQLRVARRAPAATAPSISPAGLAQAQAQSQQLAQANAQMQAELTTLRADNGRLTGQLDQLQGEHTRASTALATGEQGLAVCKAKNAQAIAVAKDILAAYDRVGLAGVLARKEPFTRLKRVEIERIEQGYGDRLYDSRLDARPRSNPVGGVKPPAPQP